MDNLILIYHCLYTLTDRIDIRFKDFYKLLKYFFSSYVICVVKNIVNVLLPKSRKGFGEFVAKKICIIAIACIILLNFVVGYTEGKNFGIKAVSTQ